MADLELNSIGNGDGNNYLLRDNSKIPLSGSNQISGDLVPATDNSIDIGSSTKNLKMLYTKGITIDAKTVDTNANGNMTYDGHIVDTIEEQGDGYIRYSNGIQICWGSVSWQSKCTNSWGSIYESNQPSSGVYAKSFIETPYVSACNTGPTGIYGAMLESSGGSNTSTPNFYLCRGLARDTVMDWRVSYVAIGRWK